MVFVTDTHMQGLSSLLHKRFGGGIARAVSASMTVQDAEPVLRRFVSPLSKAWVVSVRDGVMTVASPIALEVSDLRLRANDLLRAFGQAGIVVEQVLIKRMAKPVV